ncbi:MAG: SulP family inorganic anion transporter [Burkholderiaceae bacterium]
MSAVVSRTASLPGDVLAGAVNALTALVAVLSLGIVATGFLGPAAISLGLKAALVAVIAGGLVYALSGTTASPAGIPSSATTVIFAGLVAQVGHDPQIDLSSAQGLMSLTAILGSAVMLMGLLQIGFGAAGLGSLARFVPQPVLAGFMSGIVLLILFAQLRPLLGLPLTSALTDPATLLQIQPLALLIGVISAAAVWILGPKWRAVPAPLLGLATGIALYAVLSSLMPGARFGTMVGTLPQGWVLPDALLPLGDSATRALWQRHGSQVLLTAAMLAFIGSLESIFSAIALDQMTGGTHDSRRELMALGAANMASGLCGGMPLSLARGRAVQLIDSGAAGRRPVIAAALTFALMYAACGPLLALLPKAALAGIMVTIAVALSDRWIRQLLRQWHAGERSPQMRLSLAVVAVVCAVTAAGGFVAGLATGVLLSMLVFMRSVNLLLLRDRYSADQRPSRRIYRPEQEALLRGARCRVTVFELEGALFFGSAARLTSECETLDNECRCLVLDLRRVSTIDESGAMALQQLSARLKRRGVTMLLAGVVAGNRHGQRLRDFGCFRSEPGDDPRPDWCLDADRATESAERLLLADAGVTEPQSGVPLGETALLKGLDPEQRGHVLAVLREKRLDAGDVLFHEGDPGDALYVLTEGSISIVAAGLSERQRFVTFPPGMLFGETAMLDGSGRTAAAVADRSTVVHRLDKTAFETLSAAHPRLGQRLALNIAIHLAERLRGAATAWRASAG